MDLHLLAHFDALVRSGSVSRAAERLGLSQPAMSAALARLRELLGDPVLVRSGRTMAVTDRARELHARLAPLLGEWLSATETRAFAPDTSARSFVLVATDYVQFLLLPRLAHALEEAAPRVRLKVMPTNPVQTVQMLDSGHAEFVVGHVDDPPETLRSRRLHDESAVCLVRTGHPALANGWSLATYGRSRHIQVTSNAYRNFSAALAQSLAALDVRCEIAITVPSYLATPHIVAASDFVATLPRSIATAFAATLPVSIVPLPVEMPGISLSLLWHERHHHDPAHRWMRDLIAATLAE